MITEASTTTLPINLGRPPSPFGEDVETSAEEIWEADTSGADMVGPEIAGAVWVSSFQMLRQSDTPGGTLVGAQTSGTDTVGTEIAGADAEAVGTETVGAEMGENAF